MGVILWFKRRTKIIVKIAMRQFVPILSAMFRRNIIWIDLQLGKLSQK